MPPSIPLSSSPGPESRRRNPTVQTSSPASLAGVKRTKNNTNTKSRTPQRKTTPLRQNKRTTLDATPVQPAADETSTPAAETQNELGLYSSSNTNNNFSSGMMGGGMPYGGMYGSPYLGAPMMMGGPFSGVYQVLFGVQNVVFSLTQAVQLMGTNQHALQQAFDSLTGMMDHAIATFHELRALEATQLANESKEQQRRRRRLKALRWALMMSASWLLYKIIRRLTSRRRRIGYEQQNRGNTTSYGMTPYSSSGYAGGYNNSMMYGGGGYGSGAAFGGMFGGNPYGGYSGGGGYY